MLVKNSMKAMIAALVAASSMMTAANAAGVACPTAEAVKGADRALNAVIRQSQKTYFVLTAQPAIEASDMGWIVAAQASASGFDAAYTSAVTDVKSVVAPAMETAIEQQGVYLCAYFTSGGKMSVLAAAPQQQGFVFNPGVLNLDGLKAKN